jgi:hypothetical protein
VIGSYDSPFEERPEGIKVLSVDHPSHVLPFGVVHCVMRVHAMQSV